MPGPKSVRLELAPDARPAIVPLRGMLPPEVRNQPRLMAASMHTTAGLLCDESSRRCGHDEQRVRAWLHGVQRLFPAGLPYRHDALEQRSELSDEQRSVEPRNADAHLTFIGAGLQGCVTLRGEPAWFVDLDGVHEHGRRRRSVLAVGFGAESVVERVRVELPVQSQGLDALNLRDPALGVWPVVEELLARHRPEAGRVDFELGASEQHCGLTVNEHETLLMQHDLAAVLRDPLHFAIEKGRHLAANPRAFAWKGLDYARHDGLKLAGAVQALLGVRGTRAVRLAETLLGPAAGRLLRVRRSISLPVCRELADCESGLVVGRYQSPLLLQWRPPRTPRRAVSVTLVRLG